MGNDMDKEIQSLIYNHIRIAKIAILITFIALDLYSKNN